MQYCFTENGQNIEWQKEMDALLLEQPTHPSPQTCFITGKPLTDPMVKLICGHTFNYLPIYKDVLNFKQNFFQQESTFFKVNEIQCPYCRKKHPDVLPFFKMEGVEPVMGVNVVTPTCQYIFKQGPRKGQPCLTSVKNHGLLCNKHAKKS
jgi:hypothetical protein